MDGAICLVDHGLGSNRDGPEAVGRVALSHNDDLSFLVYFDIVLGEQGDAVVVAELADGK